MTLVSIVTPAYNAERFIEATGASVINQTYVDWEWIIVDDGSTDRTAALVERIGDPRIRLLRGPHSGLPAAARNLGLRAAAGDLVAFLDADDLWEPDKLAAQVRFLETFPDAGLVFCRYYLWFDRRPVARRIVPSLHGLPNPGRYLEALCRRNLIGTSGVVARRRILIELGGFCEDTLLRGTEDYDLWLRIAERTAIGYVDRPLFRYRIHAAGTSSNEQAIQAGRLSAVRRALDRNPALAASPGFGASDLAAQALASAGYGMLKNAAGDCGRACFARSLRVKPLQPHTWLWLAFSMLGRPGVLALRSLNRRIG